MKTNSQIRHEALELMKGNWTSGVVVTLLYLVVISACATMVSVAGLGLGALVAGGSEMVAECVGNILNILVSIFVFYPLAMSLVIMYLSFVQRGEELSIKGLLNGFKSPYYSKSVVM